MKYNVTFLIAIGFLIPALIQAQEVVEKPVFNRLSGPSAIVRTSATSTLQTSKVDTKKSSEINSNSTSSQFTLKNKNAIQNFNVGINDQEMIDAVYDILLRLSDALKNLNLQK